ncbi:DUF4174 domain-containing protein [Planktotalea arctica]|uniref:DUF4174 domain-containing protein n=1 Tax=Planktotalea arctica TaxID=1481893 RepID=UPI000A1736A4|nr:DUF4174 domain-containing protein [Planktotalea arctica]
MKSFLSFVFAALFAASPAFAQDDPVTGETSAWEEITASDSDNLNDFLWTARPVVVFADSAEDPRFAQQMLLFEGAAKELRERDVVILTDTDPSMSGALRKALRPRGFMLVLIGKDGGIKLRKASPWDVRELTRVIDKTPSRQREVRERRVIPLSASE